LATSSKISSPAAVLSGNGKINDVDCCATFVLITYFSSAPIRKLNFPSASPETVKPIREYVPEAVKETRVSVVPAITPDIEL